MKNAIAILTRVLVTYFYEKNTGFFLAVFFILFALPQNVKEFHLSLIDGFIKNPSMLLLVMAAWLLYNLKCIDYIIKQLRLPQQRFLYSLSYLPFVNQYVYFLYVQLMVYLPAVIYAGFIISIALQKGYVACAVETTVFTLTMLATTPLVYVRALQHRPFIQGPLVTSTAIRLPKPLFALPLFYLWHSRKQMLVVSKACSLLAMALFMHVYEPEQYDIRAVLLCFMLSTACNSAMVHEIKIFHDEFLPVLRNFPLTLPVRFVTILVTFTVLLMPELLFVWEGYPALFTLVDYAQVLLLGIGFMALVYAILFTHNSDMDGIVKTAFGIMAALFFIILYNPGILLEVLILAIAFGLYAAYYYDFEKVHK